MGLQVLGTFSIATIDLDQQMKTARVPRKERQWVTDLLDKLEGGKKDGAILLKQVTAISGADHTRLLNALTGTTLRDAIWEHVVVKVPPLSQAMLKEIARERSEPEWADRAAKLDAELRPYLQNTAKQRDVAIWITACESSDAARTVHISTRNGETLIPFRSLSDLDSPRFTQEIRAKFPAAAAPAKNQKKEKEIAFKRTANEQWDPAFENAVRYAQSLGYQNLDVRPSGAFAKGLEKTPPVDSTEQLVVKVITKDDRVFEIGKVLPEKIHLKSLKSTAELTREMNALILAYHEKQTTLPM